MPLSSSLSARQRAGSSSQLILLGFLAFGAAAGLLLGGRAGALGEVRLRWWGLALGGLLLQLILFSAPISAALGALGWFGRLAYVGSTVVVLAALMRNLDQPWFRLVALGAVLNLLAIVANGGTMPADPAALAAVGQLSRDGGAFTNTAPVAGAWYSILGDNWATPAWLPFANVLSVGDLIIGVGAAAWLATTMRRQASHPAGSAAAA